MGDRMMADDTYLKQAEDQIVKARAGQAPVVTAFFDEPTFTASYVVHDPATRVAAIVDSVLNFDQPSGKTATAAADKLVAHVTEQGLTIEWLLETHVHADHLSAAPYLQEKLGGKIAIGKDIVAVQAVFGALFNEGNDFARDGSQFDQLFEDGRGFTLGSIPAIALHVPGHTPVDMAFVIGDAAFVGDTIFMPDYGTSRTDFPGGDARQLYHSIRRLLALPAETRLFLCHDYKAPGREVFAWESTVGAERASNIHVHDGVGEEEFVTMRTQRDATLSVPRLILPSIQVNMRAGHFPEPDANGTRYLKIPLNTV